MTLNEVAPPTKKHERMVKHIKKSYKKDGKLTDDEKSIAYATAWKNYNKKESFEIDKTAHKAAQKKAKLRNLAKGNTNPNEKAAAEKKAGGPKLIGEKEEITKADLYKAYSKGMKMMSGTKEFKDHQEKISKMRKALKMNEGKKWDSYKKAVATVLGKKKEQRTAQKAMDAGARLRRKKQRQEYAAKVSGSEDLVPDDIRD